MTKLRRRRLLYCCALFIVCGSYDQAVAPSSPQYMAQLLAQDALAGPVRALVLRVVDGDTIEVRASIWLGQSVSVLVRIDAVDTPELRARCVEERNLALAALNFLRTRLEGREVLLTNVVYDKFGGRVRASVADSKGDIAASLLAAGLGRSYRGGQREAWCPAPG